MRSASMEHNLFVSANIDPSLIDDQGLLVRGNDMVRYTYYYQTDGSIGDAVNFLALVELWQQEPIVRRLYRNTSNEELVLPKDADKSFSYLYYDARGCDRGRRVDPEAPPPLRVRQPGQSGRSCFAERTTDERNGPQCSFLGQSHPRDARALVQRDPEQQTGGT